MIKEGFVIKSVSELKDSSNKLYAIKVNYYHEKNDKFISSQQFTVEDYKKLYGDLNYNTLVGQKVKIKEELILK